MASFSFLNNISVCCQNVGRKRKSQLTKKKSFSIKLIFFFIELKTETYREEKKKKMNISVPENTSPPDNVEVANGPFFLPSSFKREIICSFLPFLSQQ